MDITQEPINHLSICAGIDGIGRGLQNIFPNCRTIAHCEIEDYIAALLVAKMEANKIHPAPIFSDLSTFPFKTFRGMVSILSAGFPCQPFSHSGSRNSTDDARHLWPYIEQGIRDSQPGIVFLENVDGIISAKTGDGESVLLHVLRQLEDCGYICTWGIYAASELIDEQGNRAPHQRKRVFILGARELADADLIRGSRRNQSEWGNANDVGESSNAMERTNAGEEQEGYRSELAHADSQRLEGFESKINHAKEREDTVQPIGLQSRADVKWPARPGEDQYSWEEPRTIVANASSSGRSKREPATQGSGSEISISSQRSSAEGELGNTDNRYSREGRELSTRRNSSDQEGSTRELVDARSAKPRWVSSEQQQENTSAGRASKNDDQRGQIKSSMGGAADGISSGNNPDGDGVDAYANRNDRLKILGNSVIPAQAELAFRDLSKQLKQQMESMKRSQQ